MRRADRLFQIVQYLRGRRLTTARQLAEWLEVSERTIYRDVADLIASGTPIEGEAGVGYRLAAEYDLPPLMFSYDEIEALVAGIRMTQAWGSPALKKAAELAQAKIASALPKDKRIVLERTPLFAPDYFIDKLVGERLDVIREAIRTHEVLTLDYADMRGIPSHRDIRPLACAFWGGTWSVAAWCELRVGFRAFRLDRIRALTRSGRRFADEPGKTWADYQRLMEAEINSGEAHRSDAAAQGRAA
ncbi:DNA-binding transcriptional regulator [beta proteobacterium AAP99]|nr:DNA-binding transcriptional regulator [beta proteobacterium AAP99]